MYTYRYRVKDKLEMALRLITREQVLEKNKMYENSKFRNKNGMRLYRSLFLEFYRPAYKTEPLYTLKGIDWKGYPSLSRLYLEEEDLTEYQFANRYLENWDHWSTLCDSGWFKPHISKWRQELSIKMESMALLRIKEEARDKTSKNNFSANKMILDKVWKINTPGSPEKNGTNRGRPSNEEIQGELKKRADEEQQLNEDFERINGTGE